MKHNLINPIIKENYIENLLRARGIKNIDKFLNPSIENVQDPFDLDNMQKGIDLLLDSIGEEKNICLIVDCDCDGYCSAAIMYQFIKEIAPETEIEYLVHQGKAHGFEEHINYLLDKEYDLIVCPDAGSNDKEYTDQLSCPILILDHHILEKEVGDNVILINNQASNSYQNKELCGGGVVWQFVRAYDSIYNTTYWKKYIDLAALSIIGDMMGLNEVENQAIITIGLENLQNTFFIYLTEKQSYSMSGKINPTTIAFYIVPLINSMVRVGTLAEKERMFLAFVNPYFEVPCNKRGAKGTMEKVYIESARECTNTKSRQDKEKVKMTELLEAKVFKDDLLENKILFIELDNDERDLFSSELTGLVCMQLASRFQRPTLLGRMGLNDEIKGSIRGLNESALKSLKDLLDETGCFSYVQGHDNAAGFAIPETKVEEFLNYTNKKLEDVDFSEGAFDVDFERHALDSDLIELITDIANYDYIFGQKNPEPLIYIDSINLKQDDWRVMGQKKDTVAWEKNGVKYIQFHASDLIEELEKYPEVQLEVVGRATINEWMGYETPQIMIKGYEVVNGKLAF